MTFIENIPLAVWGFLVGFIGWGSCFRLVEPIGNWLLPLKNSANVVRGIVLLLVVVFLIFAILMVLAMLPAILFVAGGVESSGDEWRRNIGITFISSFIGFFFFGLMRRVNPKA